MFRISWTRMLVLTVLIASAPHTAHAQSAGTSLGGAFDPSITLGGLGLLVIVPFTALALIVDGAAWLTKAPIPKWWGVLEIFAASFEIAVGAAVAILDVSARDRTASAGAMGFAAGLGTLGGLTLAHGIWTVRSGNRAAEEPDVSMGIAPSNGGLVGGMTIRF